MPRPCRPVSNMPSLSQRPCHTWDVLKALAQSGTRNSKTSHLGGGLRSCDLQRWMDQRTQPQPNMSRVLPVAYCPTSSKLLAGAFSFPFSPVSPFFLSRGIIHHSSNLRWRVPSTTATAWGDQDSTHCNVSSCAVTCAPADSRSQPLHTHATRPGHSASWPASGGQRSSRSLWSR